MSDIISYLETVPLSGPEINVTALTVIFFKIVRDISRHSVL